MPGPRNSFMDLSLVKRAAGIIVVLLCSVLVANAVSNILMDLSGLGGPVGFVAGFIVYAAVFFGMLYLFERFGGVSIFHFNWR
jgi:hypothetical protein